MQNSCKTNRKLPYKCRMVCVTLIGGSLILALIFTIYYLGYISAETAIWVSMGAFVLFAIYEAALFTLITKHMIHDLNNKIE